MGSGRPGELEFRQRLDPDGTWRVLLLGEVDIAVAGQLVRRLRQLAQSNVHTRLDLSRLEFIDAAGLDVILGALIQARRQGWELEVDRRISPSVRRVVELAGAASAIWPDEERGCASAG